MQRNVFKTPGVPLTGADPKPRQNDDHEDRDDSFPVGSSATIPQEFVYCSDPLSGPAPRVVTAVHSMTSASSQPSAVHSRREVVRVAVDETSCFSDPD